MASVNTTEPTSQEILYSDGLKTVKTIRQFHIFRGDPEAFPGKPRDIVSPAFPGKYYWYSLGSPPSRTCLEHLTREVSRRHPNQMPEPPHLAPLDMEEH